MQAIGFSLNYLTLFGLVLAIGIVVDDAIVVVENMERNIEAGLGAREAARKTMGEVGSALVAIGLVLIAVFLPTIFLKGISGRFYQQFGTTVSVATAISVFVSLTLSPALAALLLKAHHQVDGEPVSVLKRPFMAFNRLLQSISRRYGKVISTLTRRTNLVLAVYVVLIAITALLFYLVPRGFIPRQDQGYFIVSIQLPPGASLSRTDKVVQMAIAKILETPGIANAVAFTGFSGATFSNASNAAAIFPVMSSFRERLGLSYNDMLAALRQKLNTIKEAMIVVIPPPPVRGIGNAGGFKMMIQDRSGRGIDVLTEAVATLADQANKSGAATSVFTFLKTARQEYVLNLTGKKPSGWACRWRG